MMNTTAFNESECQLKRAIARRQYGILPTRFTIFGEMASEYMSSLPAGSSLRRETAARVLATLEWASRMIRTQRTALADELNHLPLVSRYLEPPDKKPSATFLNL
jgi:hypothetical protein